MSEFLDAIEAQFELGLDEGCGERVWHQVVKFGRIMMTGTVNVSCGAERLGGELASGSVGAAIRWGDGGIRMDECQFAAGSLRSSNLPGPNAVTGNVTIRLVQVGRDDDINSTRSM